MGVKETGTSKDSGFLPGQVVVPDSQGRTLEKGHPDTGELRIALWELS